MIDLEMTSRELLEWAYDPGPQRLRCGPNPKQFKSKRAQKVSLRCLLAR
jgi:hypothetical protein